jgi:probable HAF family extracellular repeat protein
MKSRKQYCFTAITLLAALAIPVSLAADDEGDHHHKHNHYSLKTLETLGGTFGEAWGVSNNGLMAGHSTLLGDQVYHAFLWRKGVITDLGTLGGPNSNNSPTDPVNNRGAVTGFSDTSIPDPNGEDFCGFPTNLICLPFVWQNGVMIPLPLLGGNNGQAFKINNRGQIVGQAEGPNPDPCSPFALEVSAVVWRNGQIERVLPPVGGSAAVAYAINDNGEAVGLAGCITGTVYAVLWRHSKPINLGSLGGIAGNIPFDINNRGQVVGQSDLPGDTNHHAFFWQDGVMTDLGSLPGLPTSVANGINNKSQVVGFSQALNDPNDVTPVAVLWENGGMSDLNSLIHRGSLFLMEALSINDRGQIAGFGRLPNGDHRGFLLTPCGDDDPGIDDCDYSEVEESDSAIRVDPSVAQNPTTASPWVVNPMMRFLGHRTMPWYRNLGVQPPSK